MADSQLANVVLRIRYDTTLIDIPISVHRYTFVILNVFGGQCGPTSATGLRADPLLPGWWRWLPQTFVTPSKTIVTANGLDAYMSIRFLEMMMKIFAVFTLVSWPILLPVNSLGMATQSDGLGRLSFGNINRNQQPRYWAHLIIAFALTCFVLWMMRREMLIFVHLRQEFLISREHSKLAQAKTVLITALPAECASETYLRHLFSFVPGGIHRIWIYKNVPELPDLYEEREKLTLMLEDAATTLIRTAIKARAQQEAKAELLLKKQKKLEKAQRKGKARAGVFPLGVRANLEDEGFAADMEKLGAEKLLDSIHRPMHRPGWVPLVGPKVDTIEYCIDNISKLNDQITEARKKLSEAKSWGAAFIQCNLQIGAHVIGQCVPYHEPMSMYRTLEATPDDINIDDGAYEMRSRYVLSWAATFGECIGDDLAQLVIELRKALIIIWGFPVALAGFTSNVADSCARYWWLAWICKAPIIVQNLIQAVFPPLLLIVLFLILPVLLQGLAWFENIPRWSLISLSVYHRYFLFLVVHGFLIITFFSALSQVIKDLESPTRLVQNFAIYLPNASTFFLTYMLQQGLMGAAGGLLQAGPLIVFFIKKLFFGNTPRQAYTATFLMPSFDFGVVLPRMSLLATIALAYSIISPIINGLALLAFFLFWIAWKFLLIWVMDQPASKETGGLYFPLLISNLFTGLYIQHICLMGLFFFANNENGEHTSIPQGVIVVVLIILTAGTQLFFQHIFEPVTEYIPMSLSTKKLIQRFEKEKAKVLANDTASTQVQPVGGDADGDIDLFSPHRVRSVVRRKLRMPSQGHRHDFAADKKKEEEDRLAAETKKRENDLKAQAKAIEIITPDREPGTSNAVMPNGEASASKVSVGSKGSKGSKGKDKDKDKDKTPSKLLGALSDATGAIKIDVAAKAVRDADGDGDDDSDDDLEEHAFDHPSTYQPQRWVWIPRWERFPLSEELVKDMKGHSIDASDLGANIDDAGGVTVTRGPPDEDWSGGQNI
ncbi:hypothetical protein FRC17_009267 [Serendipita sp. 399]|nr:hypothetical protein FRC17_009267 [Serendipita sp. 399]